MMYISVFWNLTYRPRNQVSHMLDAYRYGEYLHRKSAVYLKYKMNNIHFRLNIRTDEHSELLSSLASEKGVA